MGGIWSCARDVPDLQRLHYDITPIKKNPVPIIWMLGAPGSGKTSQAEALAQHLDFVQIQLERIIKEEAANMTDRGKIVKDAVEKPPKKVPDTLVIDLIKEAMLENAASAKGYLITGFPRTPKQGQLFIKEISDVDMILYLSCNIGEMLKRKQQDNSPRNVERIRQKIEHYIKDVKNSLPKFSDKIENVQTEGPRGDVFGRIEAAVNIRLNDKNYNSSHDHRDLNVE